MESQTENRNTGMNGSSVAREVEAACMPETLTQPRGGAFPLSTAANSLQLPLRCVSELNALGSAPGGTSCCDKDVLPPTAPCVLAPHTGRQPAEPSAVTSSTHAPLSPRPGLPLFHRASPAIPESLKSQSRQVSGHPITPTSPSLPEKEDLWKGRPRHSLEEGPQPRLNA